MLLQLYTKLNFELVHQHARQLKFVVYCQKKTVVFSPLFEGSAEGQGWGGGGVDVAREESRRKGGVFATALPLQIRRRRPASGAARPMTNRGVPQREWSRPFFPSQVFSPLLKSRWARPIRFFIFNFVNTKQLGLLIFLSSKVRWANEFFIATKKKTNELTKFVVAIEAN
jgi:hypothetical protein